MKSLLVTLFTALVLAIGATNASARPNYPVPEGGYCYQIATCPVAGECTQHPEWIVYRWVCPR